LSEMLPSPTPPSADVPAGKRVRRGFSLLEILVATAILAIVFSYVSGSVIQSGFFQARAPMYSQAALMIRGVVLDVEAEYREDGFPENDVTNENCELPDDIGDEFECEYDVEKLELEADELGQMAAQLMENLMAGAGDGGEANILQAFSVLSFLFIAGDMPVSPLCPVTSSQFIELCSIRPEAIVQNIMGMVSFFPTIIEQAAEKTRKIKVRIRHKDFDEPILEIETFSVSVPEEQKALTEEGAVADPTTPTDGKPLPNTPKPTPNDDGGDP
jgi:prepilin-type N-terminal cleavage/methylation domain-containing protein